MPAIEFSTLSTVELRRLAKAARGRGDGVLADMVDWEIAARTVHDDHGQVRAAEPRSFDTDTDAEPEPEPDPEPDDAEIAFEADERARFEAEERARFEADARARFEADDQAPSSAPLVWIDAEPPAPSGRGGWPLRGVALVALGAIAGGGLTAGGFWALDAAGRRGPAPVTDVLTVPAPPAPLPDAAAAGPVAGTPRAEPPPAHAPHRARLTSTAAFRPVKVDPCAGWSTTADRLACSDPEIAGLARRMYAARLRAIEAGADPRVTDDTRWRQARDETGDPTRLAQIYERRIRELDAVAAEAHDREPIF